MADSVRILSPQEPLASTPPEDLRHVAGSAARWDVVHRPNTASTFPARVRAVQKELRLLEKDLASDRKPDAVMGDGWPSYRSAALLELRENFRLLRSAISGMSDNLRALTQLPRILIEGEQREPRAAACAETYIHTVGGDYSTETLRTFIRELQTHEPLLVEELWSVPSFLKFSLLESLLVEARTILDSSVDVHPPLISICIKSLRIINNVDWVSIIEPLIVLDGTLRKDPAGAYGNMDFESREQYRKRVTFIARHSDYTESKVALTVLELARESVHRASDDPRIRRRRPTGKR